MNLLPLTIVFLSVQLMPLVECPLILRNDNRWYGGLNARAYCTASGLIPSRSLPIFTHLKSSKGRIKCKRLSKTWNLFIILKDVYNQKNLVLPMIVVWGKAFYHNLTLTIRIRNTGNWSRALWISDSVKLRFGNLWRFAQARCVLVTLFFYGLRFHIANWIKT